MAKTQLRTLRGIEFDLNFPASSDFVTISPDQELSRLLAGHFRSAFGGDEDSADAWQKQRYIHQDDSDAFEAFSRIAGYNFVSTPAS